VTWLLKNDSSPWSWLIGYLVVVVVVVVDECSHVYRLVRSKSLLTVVDSPACKQSVSKTGITADGAFRELQFVHEDVSKRFRTGRLERELQMVAFCH
jgi:hypothetical protein